MPPNLSPVCPACGFRVFNRRYPKCESCGNWLPTPLALSASESAVLQEKEKLEEMESRLKKSQSSGDSGSGGVSGWAGDAGSSGDGGCGGDGGGC